MAMQAELSRDNSRTPMQWSNGINAGFTTGKPWLTINPNFTQVNVNESEKDANSILNYVKKMIALRKEHKDVLVYGKYNLLDKDNKQVYAYTRESGNKKFLVLLNFTNATAKANTGIDISKAKVLINNYEKPNADGSLKPYEAVIYEL
jgi:oligo-1,6-glucosidase